MAGGAGYNVTVKTNPSGQTCTVSSGSGTVASANVTNVAVSCTGGEVPRALARMISTGRMAVWVRAGPISVTGGCRSRPRRWPGPAAAIAGDIRTGETYTGDQYSQVEVTSTQLSGGQWIGPAVRAQNGGQDAYLGIYFWNNGSPVLRLFKRSAGSWIQLGNSYNSGPLAAGTKLELVAAGSTISFLQNGVERISGHRQQPFRRRTGHHVLRRRRSRQLVRRQTPAAERIRSAGPFRGLSGTVVLQDNGGDNLSVSANGPFTFSTPVAGGTGYNVTVKTNPSGQTCTVSSASGTVASANITNVAVSCTGGGGSAGTGGFEVQYQNTDANGVASYDVTSADNGYGPQVLRVLNPTNPAPGVPTISFTCSRSSQGWDHLRRWAGDPACAQRAGPVQPDDHRAVVRGRPLVRGQPQRREHPVRNLHDQGFGALGYAESGDHRHRAELADRVLEVWHRRTGSHPEAS